MCCNLYISCRVSDSAFNKKTMGNLCMFIIEIGTPLSPLLSFEAANHVMVNWLLRVSGFITSNRRLNYQNHVIRHMDHNQLSKYSRMLYSYFKDLYSYWQKINTSIYMSKLIIINLFYINGFFYMSKLIIIHLFYM